MENDGFDGSARKTSHEENKVNFMDDLDALTQSSEIVSESCESPYPNYRNSMLLIEQLCVDCKDQVVLLKIQDAVLSYEKLIELEKNHCELLTDKNKRMENRVSGLLKKLSKTREIKSQLEHQKVELEQELCNLRFAFKEEREKRQNADLLHKKNREQLRKKEEQYIKETKVNRELETTLRTLEMELKIVRKNFNQLQAAQDRCTAAVRCAEDYQDHVQKLEIENAKLKGTINKQAHKIEQLQTNLKTQRVLTEDHAWVRRQLEMRIKQLERELLKTKTSLDCNKNDLEIYKDLYRKELEGRKQLENELKKTRDQLAAISAELLRQHQQSRSFGRSLNTWPVPETAGVGHLHSLVPSRNSHRENLGIRTPRPRSPPNITKMFQEFEERLDRELKEDADEFPSESYRVYPVGSIGQMPSTQELLLKAKQEYTVILKKKYDLKWK